jgi:uncharacterized membrane protein
MDLMHVGASWLHLVATVALLGYYAIFGLLVIPVLRQRVADREAAATVAAVEGRATPVVFGSLAVFLATGVYLMVNGEQYGGLGNTDGSTWATFFLVKHVVVLVMVGLGVYIDALVARRFAGPAAQDRPAPFRTFEISAGAMTLLGAVVLFLTAAGQAS